MTYQQLRARLGQLVKGSVRATGTERSDFSAVEHAAPSEAVNTDKLALYTMAGCPFCVYVLRTISHLGLDVEMRDIRANQGLLEELIQARGRATVPVLWIQSPDAEVRWMPESRDIVRYLKHRYGQGR